MFSADWSLSNRAILLRHLHVPIVPSVRRQVKEDFELHGKRIKKGSTILASILYAKACDPRMSSGDHVDASVPLHMDIHQLQASVKPERWLNPANKLDMAVRHSFALQIFLQISGTHCCLSAC